MGFVDEEIEAKLTSTSDSSPHKNKPVFGRRIIGTIVIEVEEKEVCYLWKRET